MMPSHSCCSKVRHQKYTARVNSQDGSSHASRISQEATITAGDSEGSEFHVRFAWAAVLEDPSHDPRGKPYFHLTLKKTSDNTVLYSKFFYTGQPGLPWKKYPDGINVSGWQWIDWQDVDLNVTKNVTVGDTLRIELSVADCPYGGHGGYAYLDGFRSQASAIPTIRASP